MIDRKKLILLLAIFFLALPLIGFGLYAIFGRSSSVGQESVYKDKDTGEEVQSFKGVQPESDGNSAVTILGLVPLSKDIMAKHFNFVRDAISRYSKERLNNSYKVIALLPDSYKNESGYINATLRLGETSDITVPIHITASRLNGGVQVIIDDPNNKFGGMFDTGMTIFEAD